MEYTDQTSHAPQSAASAERPRNADPRVSSVGCRNGSPHSVRKRRGHKLLAFAIAATLPTIAIALPPRIEFEPGTTIEAEDFNSNFEALWNAVEHMEVNRVPVGSIVPYYGATAPPGWIIADGSKIDSATRPEFIDLVRHLQDMGLGSGSTGAVVPDLRGVFLRGQDRDRGMNPDAGNDEIGTLQEDLLGSHTHTGSASSGGSHSHTGRANTAGNHTHSATTNANTGWNWGDDADDRKQGKPNGAATVTIAAAGAHTHSLTVNSGGTHAHTLSIAATGGEETRPSNVTVLYLIRY